ncbi:ATP/DNA binding protein [Thalictrum thalictroides]|uniref:ATP/DNA binding protein n=1 Tax=Thalictrum thalictroides TaxID=46969 RepID=A0A7J6WA99_THATH|nr:ATP/DNA binding protein [Thalictrum thalictroides]
MPLLDSYACVKAQKSGVLVPANGSKWMGLIGSNPWRRKNFVELGEDYLRADTFAGVHTWEKQIINFLKTHIEASDIPDLCPPDDAFPTVASPLTKENTFLLLEWIRNLKQKRMLVDGNFLRCIKLGHWLRTYVGDSLGYRPPSQSFLLTPAFGNLLKDICELVDIPLVDQQFYDNKIIDYKEELITIGVMSEFVEACKFIGRHLMSLAANVNLTRANVYSILNFIRFLREKLLPPEDFIKSIKEGKWLRTLHGEQSPVHSILFDSEWTSAARISNLPFIDEELQIRANIVFATYFSQVIAQGLLWDREDRIAELSELIKLGWLLEFEEEAISFLLKTKNLQIFMEDVEFLKSTFSTE